MIHCSNSSGCSLFNSELKIINVGLHDFADNLIAKDVKVIHVKWSPPAMGDKNLMDLLDKLK